MRKEFSEADVSNGALQDVANLLVHYSAHLLPGAKAIFAGFALCRAFHNLPGGGSQVATPKVPKVPPVPILRLLGPAELPAQVVQGHPSHHLDLINPGWT